MKKAEIQFILTKLGMVNSKTDYNEILVMGLIKLLVDKGVLSKKEFSQLAKSSIRKYMEVK